MGAEISRERAVDEAERALAGLALALIADVRRLTHPERALVAGVPSADPAEVEAAQRAVLAGKDPLGSRFCAIRSPETRRRLGATYTPGEIVRAMVAWAKEERKEPVRIVDPGAGSGRFLVVAARRFPHSKLVGVEIDPLAALMLRANAAVLGFADRLEVCLEDYRALALPQVDGPTLFIGNPPYVRHHDIGAFWKAWFAETAAKHSFKASKLAGSHIHFFLKTRDLAQPGDFGAFITAAEWLDVNYGSVLRQMLADGLGGAALHVIDAKALPFGETLATGAITCFRVGNRPRQMSLRSVDRLNALTPLSRGKAVDWDELCTAPRWSFFVREEPRPAPGMLELGELFRVHRGQVTGSNATWIENAAMREIPARYLRPTVTRARELIAAGETLGSERLRRVLDLPVDLSSLAGAERRAVDAFLKWAKAQGAHRGYIATHRRAWWAVELRVPAPILCTYMARGAPTFVHNTAEARHLNIAHGLYPRGPMSKTQLADLLAYLRRHAGTDGGRVYAGGLVKFEPRELERLCVPRLDQLHGYLADSLDTRTVASRRGRRAGKFPL